MDQRLMTQLAETWFNSQSIFVNMAPVLKIYSTETNLLDVFSPGSEAPVYVMLYDVCVSVQGHVGLIFYRVNKVKKRRGEKSLANRFQLRPWVCASHVHWWIVVKDVVAQFFQRWFRICGGKLGSIFNFLSHLHINVLQTQHRQGREL